ncbi:Gll2284 protein [Microbacterium esteraromaticum]|uniref:Gll2284 protein n=1 Tax=Microbacterium esteraromaticum TaxID=57043 RepID=A0A1R4KQN8_9MICO|nr:hypothetical protein [Microbacterium esteraromaticum]SJN46592.1 Gll2284 protein [Microbacterium esteraromaticum]
MASEGDPTALESWLDGLDEDSIRDLLEEATLRVAGLADWLETRRAAASDDPAELLTIVNRDLTPRRRFYDYWQANRYASDAYDAVELLRTQSANATPALVPVIERAITLSTRAILKSDDSSGAQGDLVRRLLEAHAQAVRAASPALSQAEQTRVVKWIIKYRYSGAQDFFDPDIVAYAPGLSEKSITQYRTAIASTDLGEYGTYPLTRLAVLDRDRDAIVAAHGGEPKNAQLARRLVADLEEAGLHDDAVAYARIGIALDGQGWNQQLVTFVVDDALLRGAESEAIDVRRAWFARFPLASAFTALRETAEQVGEWQTEKADAEALLAQHSPQSFAQHLLDEDRNGEAWEFAVSRFAVDGAHATWLNLCQRRATTAPADTLPVYREIVQQTLEVTDKRNYRTAANVLKTMRDAAVAAGPDGERSFEAFLAQVVDQNRRRPTCIEAFRKAKLIPRV